MLSLALAPFGTTAIRFVVLAFRTLSNITTVWTIVLYWLHHPHGDTNTDQWYHRSGAWHLNFKRNVCLWLRLVFLWRDTSSCINPSWFDTCPCVNKNRRQRGGSSYASINPTWFDTCTIERSRQRGDDSHTNFSLHSTLLCNVYWRSRNQ